MNDKAPPRIIDWDLHCRNREKVTLDELLPYAGQWVAWSFEGDRIVAHSAELREVHRQVLEQGINPEEVVFSGFPTVEEWDASFLGGSMFNDPGVETKAEEKAWRNANAI